jgi:uncharacterized membrane protein YfcA
MINYELLIVLVLLAFIIGLVCTLGGIGGGVFTIPFFILILGFVPNVAKGTTLFLVLLSSAMATYSFQKNRRIHLPSTLVMGSCSIVGSIFANIILTQFQIERNLFLLMFGIFELVIAVRISLKINNLLKTRKQSRKISSVIEEVKNHINTESFDSSNLNILRDKKKFIQSISFFIFGGFLITFLGVGGGVIYSMTLIGVLHQPVHYALFGATSVLFITVLYNLIIFGINNQINWEIGIIMGFGILFGAKMGAKVAPKIPKEYMLGIITIILLSTGIILLVQILF